MRSLDGHGYKVSSVRAVDRDGRGVSRGDRDDQGLREAQGCSRGVSEG